MRFFLLLILGCAATLAHADGFRPATADEVVLFKEAMKNSRQDTEHWAYTETTTKKIGVTKKMKGETVVRFDPSKPYSQQYTLLKYEGRDPTEKERKKYREMGERRGESLARAANPAAIDEPTPSMRKKHKDTEIKPDLDHPRIASEENGRLVYDLPLISNTNDVPVDKIELRVAVNTVTRHVERASFRVKDSFRMKVVAKVKAGEGSVEFAVIDPKYGPVMTAASGNVGGSLLLIPLNANFTSKRTDFQRVKPYNERLQVKLGPLELLDF